jgi:uncharacterized protein DUF4157
VYEQEADRVAEQVMRMPDTNVTEHAASRVSPVLQRKCGCLNSGRGGDLCSECAKEERMQRSTVDVSPVTEVPSTVSELIHSSGQSLDTSTRAFMEPRFGRDLGSVRVHFDSRAAASAKAVSALAYTVGNNIVFGTGQFSPQRSSGQRLLAHEITHVLQQTEGHSNTPPAYQLQRQTEEQEEESAKAVVDKSMGWEPARGFFAKPDFKGLAAYLKAVLAGFNYGFFNRIFKRLGDYDDNVGAQLVEYLSEPELKMHAARADGRKVLNILYEAMITGDVTAYQRKQANRIIEATKISEQEYMRQAEKPMPVYPVREQGFFTQCHGGFRASLLRNGNVQIRFTSSMIWKCDMFKRERDTFAPFGGYRDSHEFSPDTLVGVRLYDLKGEPSGTISAIELIDFSNQLQNKSVS